jgi:hypothetical protein
MHANPILRVPNAIPAPTGARVMNHDFFVDAKRKK